MYAKRPHGVRVFPLSGSWGCCVPVLALGFLVVQQANFLIGRSLLIAFGDAESTYRYAWFELDGDVVAKDLVVYPVRRRRAKSPCASTASTWRRRAGCGSCAIPSTASWPHAKLDRLHLTLSGVTSDDGVDPSLGDLGPFGALSASPFEAMGCLNDDLWIHSELDAMGLMPGTTTLEFDYQREGQGNC